MSQKRVKLNFKQTISHYSSSIAFLALIPTLILSINYRSSANLLELLKNPNILISVSVLLLVSFLTFSYQHAKLKFQKIKSSLPKSEIISTIAKFIEENRGIIDVFESNHIKSTFYKFLKTDSILEIYLNNDGLSVNCRSKYGDWSGGKTQAKLVEKLKLELIISQHQISKDS